MSVSIIVPFRPDGAERDRNLAWLEARYRELYPDWELVVGVCEEGPWCKGRAVRNAVSSGDRLVISDADMYLDETVMREGVAALEDHAWVVPHERSYRLTREATEDFIAGKIGPADLTHDHLELPQRKMFPCGGLFFVRRDAYLEAGGFDERFTGWGGEDESLGMALETLYGPPKRLGSVLIHLWHQPQPEMPESRLRPPHAEELVKRYQAAHGDREAMKALAA